uniref:BEN domain-containing protein n=1 Tax=Knipowitschia caucasica TaxID=637954 RepID=A0AAV2JBG6_KNICA
MALPGSDTVCAQHVTSRETAALCSAEKTTTRAGFSDKRSVAFGADGPHVGGCPAGVSCGGPWRLKIKNAQDVKGDMDDLESGGSPDTRGGEYSGPFEAAKRLSTENQSNVIKRARICGQMRQPSVDETARHEPLCLITEEKQGCMPERSKVSHRKPLFGITHRISDKKTAPSLEQQVGQGSVDLLNSILSSKLQGADENGLDDISSTGCHSETPVYPLIEKMFFILNTLNSSMTQLHSKVDLLTIEVMRIKKQIKPTETMEFQPPPEYLLTSEELKQLMEQTANAGELGCRLLVHLFPEVFKAKECSHDCFASKRSLESLHLQLIRNYVEVCYPSVKSNSVWQEECLLQINDFFNRFWAHKDMESPRQQRKQTVTGAEMNSEQPQTYRFINEQGLEMEDHMSLNHQPNIALTDLTLAQSSEELDECSTPEDFVIFLMHRLFPELFEEGKIPAGSSGKSVGHPLLDSDKVEMIRKYMEANFPDVPEESWLQLCIQHVEDALEGAHSNGNASESDNVTDESFGHEFPVPSLYLLSDSEVREIVQQSLSVGNFAARLLVRLFPELFTQENLRLQYNHSGACNKKQLDPVRLRLIRHYVEAVYPVEKVEEVWHYECVPSIDERCRRPNRKKCDILKKAKRSSTVS